MNPPAQAKLLDLFKPPDKAGRLKSFSGLTYEFGSEFFETDLLPGLFNLGVWQTKGWSSRIALERYLDESYVGVVMDGGCYHGRPSLRIDLAGFATNTRAKQHAKVYLLHFEECVRLITGSANLTERAFRGNREGIVAIDCTPKRPEAVAIIEDAISGWMVNFGGAVPEGMAIALGRALEASRGWHRVKGGKQPPVARFCWGGAGISLAERMADAWPEGEAIASVDVVSPFWSRTDAAAPEGLVRILRKRGLLAEGARMRLLAEARIDTTHPEPSIPPALVEWARRASGVTLAAVAVDVTLTAREREPFQKADLLLARRSLHAKMVLLRGLKSSLLYIGSANCTPGGWGLRRDANIEAGLILVARGTDVFLPLLPPTAGEEIDLASCQPSDVAYTVEETPCAPWPEFLEGAVLRPAAVRDRLILELSWRQGSPPKECEIGLTRGAERLVWRGASGTQVTSVDLTSMALETLLVDREVLVRWGEPHVEARFPVLVDERAKHSLPLAPSVRLPAEEALLSYYQGRIRFEDLFPDPTIQGGPDQTKQADTESRVDTSRILAYQMREFVEALPGLFTDLPDSPAEERVFRRSLLGAVSPVAWGRCIRDACRSGKRSGTASLFQLVELQLAIAQARARMDGVTKSVDAVFEEALGDLQSLVDEVKGIAAGGSNFAAFERRVRVEIKHLGEARR